jgi:hypothetical protein
VYQDVLIVFNAKFADGMAFLPHPQVCTDDLIRRIDECVEKYRGIAPQIYQIKKHFEKLPIGNKFFTFWNVGELSHDDVLKLSFSLSEMNGTDFSECKGNVTQLRFVLDNYELNHVGPSVHIGESRKENRVCRFCNKRMPDVSFKKKAHAITEALGNKNIIINDECDSCNESFGKGIEEALISFLGPFRSIFGVKGKNGYVKSVSSDHVVEYDDDTKSVRITTSKNFESLEKGLELTFDTSKKISAQDVYRCLVKFALSMIDDYDFDQFEDTVNWVKNESCHSRLPLVASALSDKALNTHPDAVVFKRKAEDGSMPLYFCELNVICFKFVFIIPLIKGQLLDFADRDSFMSFWDRLDHYKFLKWSFYDMSSHTLDRFSLNINFVGPDGDRE